MAELPTHIDKLYDIERRRDLAKEIWRPWIQYREAEEKWGGGALAKEYASSTAKPQAPYRLQDLTGGGAPIELSGPGPDAFREVEDLMNQNRAAPYRSAMMDLSHFYTVPAPEMDRDLAYHLEGLQRLEGVPATVSYVYEEESPTENDPVAQQASAKAVVETLDWIGYANTELGTQIIAAPAQGATLAEIAAAMGDSQVATIMTENLFGPGFGQTHRAQVPADASESVLEGLEYMNDNASDLEKQAVLEALSGLKGRHRDSYMAWVSNWLYERSIGNIGDSEEQFIAAAYQVFRTTQQDLFSIQSPYGALGEFVSQPYRLSSQVQSTIWSWASSPQQAWYRDDLSPGQNYAITTGNTPDESSFYVRSGVFDAIDNVVGDPLAWVANTAIGYRFAKTMPLMSGITKPQAIRAAFIPFKGGRTLRLPVFSRGSFARMGYLFGARTSDEMLNTPQMTKAIEFIHKNRANPGVLFDAMPQLDRAVGLVDDFNKFGDTTDDIKRLLSNALDGAYGDDSLASIRYMEQYDAAADRLNNEIRSATAEIVQPRAAPGEAAKEVDEEIRRSVLSSSEGIVSRIAPEFGDEITTVGSQGEATFRTAKLEDGSVVAVDADGRVIGGYIGDSLGVSAELERRGVGGELTRQRGKTAAQYAEEAADKEASSVSGAGAGAINKALQGERTSLQAVADLGTYTTEHGVWQEVDGVLRPSVLDGSDAQKVLVDERARILNFEQKEDEILAYLERSGMEYNSQEELVGGIIDYGNKAGYDIIESPNRLIVLDEDSVLRGVDSSNPARNAAIDGAFFEFQKARKDLATFASRRNTEAYIIKDMPTGKFLPDVDDAGGYRPRFASGSSNSKSWWARTIKARLFGQYPPSEIDIGSAAQGTQDIRRFMHYVGVPATDVNRMVNEFLEADFVDRYDVVRRIIQEAGDIVDHPLIRHNLIQYVNKEGVTAYGSLKGREVLRTASRDGSGRLVARPYIPSMMTTKVGLPDPVGFMKSLRRYKWAQNRGPRWNRGLLKGKTKTGIFAPKGTPRTRDRRAALVATIKERLGKEIIQESGLNDDEILAMAYAWVGPGTPGYRSASNDAMGAIAHMGNFAASGWKWAVKGFSLAQLAFRPFAWGTRVLLDENARAAFAGMPTVMARPQRYLTTWFDAYALRKANAYKEANLRWANDVQGNWRNLTSPGAILREAKKVFPNIEELVDPQVALDPRTLKRALGELTNDVALKNNFGAVVSDVPAWRQRVYGRAIEVADELGVNLTREGTTFTWQDDVSEIANSGWATLGGLMHTVRPVEFRAGQMTPDSIQQAARIYQNNLQLLANDPLIGVGMRRIGNTIAGDTALPDQFGNFINSRNWSRMRPYVSEWGIQNGLGDVSDAELLQRYVDDVIVPVIWEQFGPLVDGMDDLADVGRVFDDIFLNREVMIEDQVFNFRQNNEGLATMELFLTGRDTAARQPGTANPRVFDLPLQYSYQNPHSIMDEPTSAWQKVKNIPNWALRTFGDELSQRAIRRQTFLEKFRQEKALRMDLGMSEKAATEAAKAKAAQFTNDVYYNLENATPFLKNMNYVIPFFTAAYEIAETWAWKIPMMQGGFGLGHANVIRKIDRVMDAMRSLGLVVYDENGVPTLNLDLEADRGLGAGAGDTLSKGGALLVRQPLLITEFMLNLRQALTTFEFDQLTNDRQVPTEFSFSVSAPTDFSNYGIGSALDVNLSAQPLGQLAVSKVADAIPAIAGTVTITGSGNLAEIAEANEVDPQRLIGYNVDALSRSLSSEEYFLLRTGKLDPSEVDLTGIELAVPNSSIWSKIAQEVFFPFGDVENTRDVAQSFQPSWVKYFWRAFGLWQDGDIEDGFQGIFTDNFDRSAMNGQVLSSLNHLNAKEGIIDTFEGILNDFYEMASPHIETGAVSIDSDRIQIEASVPTAERDAIKNQFLMVQDYEEYMWDRAIADAGGVSFMKMMLAIVLPGTPRMFYEEQAAVDEWRASQNYSRDGELVAQSNVTQVVDFLRARAADSTGNATTLAFLENHPELKTYLYGKTYWGPGGEPPLGGSIDLYFDDLDAGLVKPVPYDIQQHRIISGNIETERQVAYIERYGNDPYRAAANSLSDPVGYRDMMAEFNSRRHMQDWQDELRGSKYRAWKERGRKDTFDIVDEKVRRYDAFEDTLSDLIQIVEADPTMPINEVEDISKELRGLRAGISEINRELEYDESVSELDWLTPLQRTRLRYFEEFYAPYLDEVSPILDKISDAQTSEERDALWNEYAQVNDAWRDMEFSFEEAPDVLFPSPVDYRLQNKDPEIRDRKRSQYLIYKNEWLSSQDVEEVLAVSPQLERFLPSTPFQRSFYDEYNNELQQLDVEYANGTGDMTARIYQRRKDILKRDFETDLRRNGMEDQLDWQKMWPIQRLAVSEELPPSIARSGFLEEVNAIQKRRAARGYSSVGEDDRGRRAITRQVWDRIAVDPLFESELIDLGITLWGTSSLDEIVPSLFFNDTVYVTGN